MSLVCVWKDRELGASRNVSMPETKIRGNAYCHSSILNAYLNTKPAAYACLMNPYALALDHLVVVTKSSIPHPNFS